jgi:hypothetical protein
MEVIKINKLKNLMMLSKIWKIKLKW